MHMQIVWGKILPGQWDAFEAAFKMATARHHEVKGLRSRWLLRDRNDPDAGYSVSLWESEADMQAFWESPARREGMALIQPFFANQYTVTQCEVRVAVAGAAT
jgi:heme-degrading monooxygenase HmoA